MAQVPNVNWLDFVFAAFFVDHLMIAHFLGMPEFLANGSARDQKRTTALVGLILLPATLLFWWLHQGILVPTHLAFFDSIAVLAILALVMGVVGGFKKILGPWRQEQALLSHSFLVGGMLYLAWNSASAVEVMAKVAASVLSYLALLALFSAIERRLDREKVPVLVQGLPLQLVTLGLVWLVFHGLQFAFSGPSA